MNMQAPHDARYGLIYFGMMFIGELLFFGVPALLWAAIGKQPFGQAFYLRRRPRWNEMTGATLIALGMVPAAHLVTVAQNDFFPHYISKLKQPLDDYGAMMTYWWFLAVPLIPLAAAVTEELFFRGVLQNALLKRLPVALALTGTSLIFAILHFELRGMIIHMLMGLVLGWIVYRSKSLYPAVWAHFWYDAALMSRSVWRIRGHEADRTLNYMMRLHLGSTGRSILFNAALGGACLLLGVYLMRRAHRRISSGGANASAATANAATQEAALLSDSAAPAPPPLSRSTA